MPRPPVTPFVLLALVVASAAVAEPWATCSTDADPGDLEVRAQAARCPAFSTLDPALVSAAGVVAGWAYRLGRASSGDTLDRVATLALCPLTAGVDEQVLDVEGAWPSVAEGGAGADVDRDGFPDLAVVMHSGGSRCCHGMHVVGLAPERVVHRPPFDVNVVPRCSDLDGDGRAELWWQHPLFAEIGAEPECTDLVPVVAGFTADGRVVNHVRAYPSLLATRLATLRAQCAAHANDPRASDCTYAEAMLRYLAGDEVGAFDLLGGVPAGVKPQEAFVDFLWDVRVGWLNHRWSDDPPLVPAGDLPAGDLAPTTQVELDYDREGGG